MPDFSLLIFSNVIKSVLYLSAAEVTCKRSVRKKVKDLEICWLTIVRLSGSGGKVARYSGFVAL